MKAKAFKVKLGGSTHVVLARSKKGALNHVIALLKATSKVDPV
jgi:hypothetical protein